MAEEFNSAPPCTELTSPDCVFAALAIPAGDGAYCFVSCKRPTYEETMRGRETPSLISTLYLGIKPRQSFREGYSLACVPGVFWGGVGGGGGKGRVFFCGSQSNRGSNAGPRLKQKTMGEGGGEERISSPPPLSFSFSFLVRLSHGCISYVTNHMNKRKDTPEKNLQSHRLGTAT